jgi:hypothetical protein
LLLLHLVRVDARPDAVTGLVRRAGTRLLDDLKDLLLAEAWEPIPIAAIRMPLGIGVEGREPPLEIQLPAIWMISHIDDLPLEFPVRCRVPQNTVGRRSPL